MDSASDVEAAAEAIRAGRLAIVPTDTVYGLAASAYAEAPVRRLYRAKGREDFQPIALVASDIEMLLECLPELRGRAAVIARALLPGPYTLIVPNPARRYRWLSGSRPDTIGVRVPSLEGKAADLLSRVGAMAATSANLPGGPDPRTIDDVPAQIRAAAEAIVDAGPLPGKPSTVIDFTGAEPVVLREGAVPADEALRLVGPVL
ncbi:MAG: L-threonylcarbamoyladenylate synthase [Gaiellaceae bacterium]|jgi:L-threonylcarbamoyladenylate synthase|nr:L-threonylcarbamoyladenylate synthase [Gaiellaceae bacterium]